jgi:hypothetical protein
VPIDAATRRLVRERARDRCEYCQLPQKHSESIHHIEHIVARQHGGPDEVSNLALSCHRCNLHKGPNLSGVDPVTHQVTSLFHPRQGQWEDHFVFRGTRILGLSPSGRTTVKVLGLNDIRRIELRQELLALGESFYFPDTSAE